MKSFEPRWSLTGMPVSCWNHPDSAVSHGHPVIILKSPALRMLLFWRQKVSTLSSFSSGFLPFLNNMKEQFRKLHMWMKTLLIRKTDPYSIFIKVSTFMMRSGACQHPAHRDTEREVSFSNKTYLIIASETDKRWVADLACFFSPSTPILLPSTAGWSDNLGTVGTFFKRAFIV